MKGYVARKGNCYYAVIYEGTDPLTGRDRRRWHPAGTDRDVAEALACRSRRSTSREGGRERSSLTVAVYLTQRWLPAKKLALRPSTWDAYRRDHRPSPGPTDRADPVAAPAPGSPRTSLRRPARRRTSRRHRRAQQQDRGRDPHDPATRARRRGAPWLDPVQPGHRRPRPEAAATLQHHLARLDRPATRSVPDLDPRSPLPRRDLGHRQHRDATRRDPRAPLGRRRLRHRTPLRHPLTRVGRLRAP